MPSMEHVYRWSVFRAKSQHNEKSNTGLELFELIYGNYTNASKIALDKPMS